LKDALRLLVYLLATVLVGALLAPWLFWSAQWVAAHSQFTFLARYEFETFFHRGLLLAALVLLWPLIGSLQFRNLSDLQLVPDLHWRRDLLAGFLLSATPLLCCGAILLASPIFSVRGAINWAAVPKVVAATAFVPMIEEAFFRGLILGILLRAAQRCMPARRSFSVGGSIFFTSAFYSIVHFLKAPDQTSPTVTWISGFNSIGHAFAQFADPVLVAAGFTTLFLIGWILADARLRTRALWLPIGLHAGWIFTAGVFGKIARREFEALPWLGKNLLVGIVPLVVACLTWLIMRGWLKYVGDRNT